jgi:hypothetical protein
MGARGLAALVTMHCMAEDDPFLPMDTVEAIEALATLWLATEQEARDLTNAGGSEERARSASAAYERAVTSASAEDLLIAWHAALRIQYACEMGSASWAEARAVSELLRVEYLARGD